MPKVSKKTFLKKAAKTNIKILHFLYILYAKKEKVVVVNT